MILLDSKHIERTLRRMAYQIVEEAHGAPILMVGLNERGYSIAKQMHSIIEKESGTKTPLFQLDADDDREFSFDRTIVGNPVLVIIDDVIFSGATFQKAMDKISERSEFQKIFISVLIDRGHRKYPILAAVTGAHIPTKLNEQVILQLKDSKPHQVVLEKS
jgi:pyrimidine operon attenuation protein / uracil phosphoribosyltransferase